MFNLFRRRPPKRNPTPPWVRWLVIGVMLYAMLAHQFQGPDGRVRQAVNQATEELGTNPITSEFEKVVSPSSRVHELAAGEGNPALCGQEVAIRYRVLDAGDKPTPEEATKENPYRFRVGFEGKNPAIERFSDGLLVGGARSVTVGNGDQRQKYEITLLDISPALPPLASIPFRIFQKLDGGGKPVTCGQPVTVQFIVWDIDGKKLYETKQPVTFTLGKSELFIGLEQGVIGMRPGSTRALIVPPVFQKTLLGNKPLVQVPFPKGQTVMVDIEMVK